MTKKTIHTEVIHGYRNIIHERYQFDTIRKKYTVPPSFDLEKARSIHNYFLNYIYPSPEKREVLDKAFHSLDNYIKHPEKLLRLLIDSSKLLWKYGRHLPKILRAGLHALKSFRSANSFEDQLVEQAISMQMRPPYDRSKFSILIRALPKKDLDEFVNSCQSLFETLHDRELVRKVLEIVNYLIQQMQQRPQVYGKEEIQGLEVGRDLIWNGNTLFEQFPPKERQAVFDLIFALERDGLEGLYRGEG